LGYHGGASDYWVGVRGNVYDLTKFYKVQYVAISLVSRSDGLQLTNNNLIRHSDIPGQTVTSELMLELGGLDVTPYFPM